MIDHAGYIQQALDNGSNCYVSSETKEEMNLDHHRLHLYKEMEVFYVGGFKILPFNVFHDVKTHGFLLFHKDCGHTLFVTDTYYIPTTFDNLQNIIVEANYCEKIINEKLKKDKKFLRDRVLRSHLSLDTCKKFLLANDLSKVNNIVLIHLSDSNSNAVQFQKEIYDATLKNVTVAENGMTINFQKTPF